MSEYKLSDRIRSGTDIMQRIVGGQRSALIELSDEVAALEAKLERMERALARYSPHVNGLVSSCAVCERRKISFDYAVSNEFWRQHIPDEIRACVVCLNCLERMAGGIPEEAWEILYYTGSAGTVAFIPVHALAATQKE